MRILQVSSGLPPKRTGGAPAYLKELRDELIRRGHGTLFLDTQNQDGTGKARIIQTNASPYEFAFYNSGAQLPWGEYCGLPLSDIRASRQVKKCFLEFIVGQKPDVIHFHELLCFPMELVSSLHSLGQKLLFTAHDYFSICPTIKLLRPTLRTCMLQASELECHRCVRQSSSARVSLFYRRNRRVIEMLPAFLSIFVRRLDTFCGRIVFPWVHTPKAYKTRRLEALEHLRAFDLILCISRAQQELMEEIAGPLPNQRQIYLSRKTYGHSPAIVPGTNGKQPLRFVGLNLGEVSKGRDLLLREFAELRKEIKSVELHVYGGPKVDQPGVVSCEGYTTADLGSISASLDVGIIPSIWAETYGYIGPEMLTRGMPLIVSSTGAMKEYVISGFNGLVFDPDKPGSLRDCMKLLATDKNLLARLRANAPASEEGLISFSRHVDEMEMIYRELAAR